MEILIFLAGEQIGPFSEQQVRRYLGEGLVTLTDFAYAEGMAEWQPLERVLAELPPSPPADAEIVPDAAVPVESPVAETPEAPPPLDRSGKSAKLDPTSSGPLADAVLSLTASQRTKRKLGKIVIQQILPLETTMPLTRKSPTGKTALAPESSRSTTSLPGEKKSGKIPLRPGQLLRNDTSAKTTVAVPVQAPPPLSIAAPAKRVSVPRKPWLPPLKAAGKKAFATFRIPRLPSRVIYVGAGLVLALACVILGARYLGSRHAASVGSENSSVPPTHENSFDSKRDLNAVILDYTRALELNPNDALALYHRGLAYQAKGDRKEAIADYTKVITLNPKNADAFSNRGFIKQAMGDLDGALADYAEALHINPKIPVAYYNEGLIKVQKGDLDGAIAAYDQALDLDPKMAVAYYNRGNTKNTEGNLDGAIADYTQALALNPKIALAYCNRGFARQSKGDNQGALADYAQALALDPKMAVAFYNRGLIKEQMGDLDGAISDSSQALALDPKNAQAYCNRGLARLGRGNLDGALADLTKFCALAPRDNDADYARLYIWLISTEENPQGHADRELTAALQNDWNSPPEDLSSKIASFLLGRISESELLADAASPDPLQEAGQRCKAWYFAGMKQVLAGNIAAANDDFHQCLDTGKKDFCEYTFASLELQTLARHSPISSSP